MVITRLGLCLSIMNGVLLYNHYQGVRIRPVDRKKIKKIIVGSEVTKIHKEAFEGLSNLVEVCFSGATNVTEIGDEAFSGCSSLANIALPKSITKVGKKAFHSCHALEILEFPPLVEELEDYVFQNCCCLRTLGLSDNKVLKRIGEFAFRGCSELTVFGFPATVTEIGRNAFSQCALTKLNIPPLVESISLETFSGNAGLKEISIPPSVKFLGKYAFFNCYALAKVTISHTIESVHDLAFSNCRALMKLAGTMDVLEWLEKQGSEENGGSDKKKKRQSKPLPPYLEEYFAQKQQQQEKKLHQEKVKRKPPRETTMTSPLPEIPEEIVDDPALNPHRKKGRKRRLGTAPGTAPAISPSPPTKKQAVASKASHVLGVHNDDVDDEGEMSSHAIAELKGKVSQLAEANRRIKQLEKQLAKEQQRQPPTPNSEHEWQDVLNQKDKELAGFKQQLDKKDHQLKILEVRVRRFKEANECLEEENKLLEKRWQRH